MESCNSQIVPELRESVQCTRNGLGDQRVNHTSRAKPLNHQGVEVEVGGTDYFAVWVITARFMEHSRKGQHVRGVS